MRLGDLVAQALDGALKALARSDLVLADRVVRDDLEVNRLRYQLEEELVGGLAAAGGEATYMLWVTHNLERIADRATNVCERVVYLVTGRVEELNVSKY